MRMRSWPFAAYAALYLGLLVALHVREDFGLAEPLLIMATVGVGHLEVPDAISGTQRPTLGGVGHHPTLLFEFLHRGIEARMQSHDHRPGSGRSVIDIPEALHRVRLHPRLRTARLRKAIKTVSRLFGQRIENAKTRIVLIDLAEYRDQPLDDG
jgi:hypothetical protein